MELPTARSTIRGAEVVIPCPDLAPTLAYFIDTLGFRLDAISPAESPDTASISGFGICLRLDRAATGESCLLRLLCDDPSEIAHGQLRLTAPNGTRIELAPAIPPLVVPSPQPTFELSRVTDGPLWVLGRAGMLYRDLIPQRQGGRIIGSQILLTEGGPVADYVHYHRVQFQMIYCHRGWVRVLYEDQGPPFVMHAGDCVLQAPEIRHRVLESSSGTEVIEFTCPARHDTFADHDLVLPNSTVAPNGAFNGQQFVHHQATAAVWRPWFAPGFECRDLGVAQGSAGIARADVLRRCAPDTGHQPWCHDGDFWSLVVLNGSAELQRSGSNEPLEAGDCAVIPSGEPFTLARNSTDFEFLEVAMPAGGLRTVGSS